MDELENWEEEFEKEYYLQLREFLKAEYANPAFPVYPKMNDIFNALRLTDYHAVKAVIIGQDPYHGEGQAHGLCFSVKPPVEAPISAMTSPVGSSRKAASAPSSFSPPRPT